MSSDSSQFSIFVLFLNVEVLEAKQRECKVGLDGALVADSTFVDVVFQAFKERPSHIFTHLLDRCLDRGLHSFILQNIDHSLI
jgi:hypothetical protein